MIIPSRYWPQVFGGGGCCVCNKRTLFRVHHTLPDGAGFWCPACDLPLVANQFTKAELVQPKHGPDLLPNGTAPSITYEGKLHPNGLVTFVSNVSCATLDDIERMSRSLGWLHVMAQKLQAHLRGADRYIFSRDEAGTQYTMRYRDQTVDLCAVKNGKLKRSGNVRECTRCQKPMPAGTVSYDVVRKPTHWGGGWRDMRFCAACVEAPATVAARQVGHLRLVSGGRS